MKTFRTLLVAALSTSVSAWIPGYDRDIFHETEGHNLFKRNMTASKRWLPGHLPIRGVNLGSMFVAEPWLFSDYWQNTMGCMGSGYNSEFDCVLKLGQSQANKVFQQHWATWITQADIQKMASYGLNTIRIPVGYWINEAQVTSSEHFPQGGFAYLLQVCEWAAQQGFYIIMDLHGAPYSQAAGKNADTGQYTNPGFYTASDAFSRAEAWVSWMANAIHTHSQFRNVGMIEILNEPVQDTSQTQGMLNSYYPGAYNAIRNAESNLGIAQNNLLHIQAMNEKWGSGNPNQALSNLYFMAYDDHRYLKWAYGEQDTQSWYLNTACNDDRGGNWPTIVGEWSLSTNNNEWPVSSNFNFYHTWWAANVRQYEKQDGWIFWTWKTSGLNDPRWDYQLAVSSGIISSNPDDAYNVGGC